MDDSIRRIGVLADDVAEAPVGGDDGILFLNREREIETIIGRMIEIEGIGKIYCSPMNDSRPYLAQALEREDRLALAFGMGSRI